MTGQPWTTEPNSVAGIDDATGYATQISRGPGGHLCGYVGVPKEHPWFGKSYSDAVNVPPDVMERTIDVDKVGAINLLCASADTLVAGVLDIVLAIDVHGGMTFAASKAPLNDTEGLWWFGFDCAHYGDMAPEYASRYGGSALSGVYRDLPYVQNEVAALAKQLSAFAQPTA